MTDSADTYEEVFAALADPTRRRILDLLAAKGAGTATTLGAALPVSRQAVVRHLAVLESAELVEGQRSGREMRYVVRPAQLDQAARAMVRLAADWDGRLRAIKRLAEAAYDRPVEPPSPSRP